MKLLLASSLTALGLAIAAPAMAQSVYIGPGGVGVGVGQPYGAYRERDGFERRQMREGRSAYEPRRHERGYDRRF